MAALAADMSTRAAAPSVIGDELPAVTVPSPLAAPKRHAYIEHTYP